MLIELSHTLEDSLETLLKKRAFVDCVRNLALAFYEGKHVVTGPYHLLRKLESAKSIPEEIRGIIRIIKGRRTDSENLKSCFSMRVVVCEESSKTDFQKSEQIYNVSYQWFADTARIQSTRLLCESQDDADIYKSMTEAFLSVNSSKYRSVVVSFRPSPCGGSGIGDRLKEIKISEGASLCIVDSDRKWPDGSLGDTAKHLQKAAKELEGVDAVAGIIILECHELENIIPVNLIFDSMGASVAEETRSRFMKLNELNLLGATKDDWFFDLKEGLRQWDLHNHDARGKTFFSGIASRNLKIECNPDCADSPLCKKRDDCSCILIAGLSETMLPMVAKHLKMLTVHKLSERTFCGTESNSRAYWVKLCHILLSWGCAYKRHMT